MQKLKGKDIMRFMSIGLAVIFFVIYYFIA